MLRKMFDKVFNVEMGIRERIFRMIMLLGSVAAFSGIVESFLLMDFSVILIPLGLLFIIMIISLVITFKYRKITLASWLVGLGIALILFPEMFFLAGGLDSGAAIWFVLALYYAFIMFSGKQLFLFLFIVMGVDTVTYLYAYYHPEILVPMSSKASSYMDSIFAVFFVGIMVGLILKFQMHLFEKESAVVHSQKDELEEAGRSKNKFFASMSHEIRTPINTIIGLDEMILRSDVDPEIREYARSIQSAGKMLLSLVNDILDISRIEMNRMQIIPGEYETKKLFGDLIDMVEVQMREKKLDFYVDIDSQLPSVLWGDNRRIEQVLINLLTNAVKYTDRGSVTLSAHMESHQEDTVRLKISVRDTGIGIRKEDLEFLFDSFRRIDEKRNQNVEGSGLGLSITKQLLRLMNGEITVDSIYTKGSVFTVTLEQKVIDPAPIGGLGLLDRDSSENTETYHQAFEAPEARILIVDDNAMNAMVAKELLTATKMQIDTASSGKECLEKTKKKFYHIILMDYLMPEMDGAQTLEAIRSQENGLCKESFVIVLTANTTDDARRIYEENGFDGYFEKPIRATLLEKELLRFLPEDVVEYRRKYQGASENEAVGILPVMNRKRKRVCVTSDCVCDLPAETLEKYDVRLLYLYIRTDKGRFADTIEINSDHLAQYISTGGRSRVTVEDVTVEDYEQFFADSLSEAEEIVHITMASGAGGCYNAACIASQGFDNVHVIDSGHIAGGEGLVVLHAAQMAAEGKHADEICREAERIRESVESCYLLPEIHFFQRRGYINSYIAGIFKVFHLHPMLRTRQGRLMLVGARAGNLENAWKRFLRSLLRHKRKIDTGIVIVSYAGCSVRQQELLRREILKRVPFETVILHKTSFSNSCISGIEGIGVSYYLKR